MQKSAPALAEAAALVGDPAVRNRGTIGGNIAHADPASDLPTVLVALDARIVAVGPTGERTIAADGFFTGIMTTALADDEVVTAIVVPVGGARTGIGLREVLRIRRRATPSSASRRRSRWRTTSARRRASRSAGSCRTPRRATAVEKALVGKALDTAADCGRGRAGRSRSRRRRDRRHLRVGRVSHRGGAGLRQARDCRGGRARRARVSRAPLAIPPSVDALQEALARRAVHRRTGARGLDLSRAAI